MNSFHTVPTICLLATLVGQAIVSIDLRAECVGTAAELRHVLYDQQKENVDFDITGRLVNLRRTAQTTAYTLEDNTGRIIVSHANNTNANTVLGDRLRISGKTIVGKYGIIWPHVANISVLGPSGSVPEPRAIDASQFLSSETDCRFVRLTGTVKDLLFTEDNPYWIHLVLVSDGEVINVSIPKPKQRDGLSSRLIGATVSVDGVVVPSDRSPRRQLGRILTASSIDAIKILATPASPRSFPSIDGIHGLRPSEIAALDRHSARGTILAVWHGDRALLKTVKGNFAKIEFADNHLPDVGDSIEAIGFPESDLYRINLTRVRWQRISAEGMTSESPQYVKASDLCKIVDGHVVFSPLLYGCLVRIEGQVLKVPRNEEYEQMLLECGNLTISIEIGSCRRAAALIPAGSRISVTGICMFETDIWRPNASFPQIRSVTILPRSNADITILSRPSWFTVGRLLALLGAISLAAVIILIWNLVLRKEAERRARELTEEAVAHAESKMKIEERTRLAVELHDSIAQNLTGVAMELEAAKQYEAGARPELLSHLEIAWNTLRSCRSELRNCLWDLRSRALEETDFNESIRRMLKPCVNGADVMVRIDVPRESLTDNTAHTIMRIIRELTVNAVRHGGATRIRVAGSFEADAILFSVRDNGCGFDPNAVSGVETGHFGLEGIRERARSLDGRLHIESVIGKGTRAFVRIHCSSL